MSRMSGVNRFHKERYECPQCERDFRTEEVEDTWLCPICNEYIHVWGETEDGCTRSTLIRKKAKDVSEGDMLIMPGNQSQGGSYVFRVTVKNGTAYIAIKGYGTWKPHADYPVNIQTGSW